jgi:hypothetical protein
MKKTLMSLAALTAATLATPASAGSTVSCAATDWASTCLAFQGNLNSNSSEAELDAAIEQLIGGPYAFDFNAVAGTKNFFTFDGNDPLGVLTFQQALYGEQILSVKVKNNTLLYRFDFGTQGATSVTLNVQGLSNAVLVTPNNVPPIPEPTTWMMMIGGFGAAGFAVRRGKRRKGLAQLV